MSIKHFDLRSAFRWALVLLWMLVIFIFSAQKGDDSGKTSSDLIRFFARLFIDDFDSLPFSEQSSVIELWQLFVRKAGHFSEFALLSILFANAIRPYKLGKIIPVVSPVLFCFIYAISDEAHQYFVPGRVASFTDVLIDTGGAVFGLCLFLLFSFVFSKIKASRHANH